MEFRFSLESRVQRLEFRFSLESRVQRWAFGVWAMGSRVSGVGIAYEGGEVRGEGMLLERREGCEVRE